MGSCSSRNKSLKPNTLDVSETNSFCTSQVDRLEARKRRRIIIHSTIPDDFHVNRDTELPLFGDDVNKRMVSEINDEYVQKKYIAGKTLGVGASGTVFLVTHRNTFTQYACKVITKDNKINDDESMTTELDILKMISHDNLIKMHELYETPDKLWMILDYADGGDLSNFVAKCPLYTEQVVQHIMKQIVEGVHYLHELGVVHRDLKLDNILLSGPKSSPTVKITDFGLSALVELSGACSPNSSSYPATSSKRKKFTALSVRWGTKEFFAPEVISEAYGPQADVWALGCVLYELLCGDQAFPEKRHQFEKSLYERITYGKYDMSSPCWKTISSDAKNLLKRMLIADPVKRLTCSDCLKHSFVTAAAAVSGGVGSSKKSATPLFLATAQQRMKTRLHLAKIMTRESTSATM